MKTIIPLVTLVTAVSSAAIAPALNADSIKDRQIHNPDAPNVVGEPSVDTTSTRGQWVTSYSNDKSDVHNDPTVDGTSTRGQWVTSYSNDKSDVHNDPTVDGTSTRGQWVTSYPPTVDGTSTRGQWVTSYSNGKYSDEWGLANHVNHWIPTGPAYLDVDTLEVGYKAHLMITHDSSSWMHSRLSVVKRFFNGGTG